MTSFWMPCQSEHLEQGDFLPECWIAAVEADFDPAAVEPLISFGKGNLIIVTQSCDLANDNPFFCSFSFLSLSSRYLLRHFA